MYHKKVYYYISVYRWTTHIINGEPLSEYEPFIIYESEDYNKALAVYEKAIPNKDIPQISLYKVTDGDNELLKLKDI